MTTAPDLPLSGLPAAAPVQPRGDGLVHHPRPLLTVVASRPTAAGPYADEIEFEDALRAAGPRLKRYAARRLRDEHEAEEVVQEAMLRAFQHRHLLATDDDLMAWLTVVTGRLVIDRLRVRGRATPVAEVPAQNRPGRDTAEVVVARDEARLALDALEAMPGRQASVLWAREVEGLSYDEIGDRFGMSEPSVRSLLHRARKTLRREYAARGGSLPAVGLTALAPWVTGLRAAGRLRHLARRGAGAAAVAATGIVAVTATPFGGFAAPAPAHPHLRPAIGVVTTSVAATHPQRQQPAPVVRPVRHAAAAAAVGGPGPASPQIARHRLPVPRLCVRHGYSVGCQTHQAPTLYVGPALPAPVAGVHRVGVSNSKVDCTPLPTTPVTECDTRGATQ